MSEPVEKTTQDTLIENIKTIFWAVLIALAIRSFLFEPFRIPSGSMYPTLEVGDYLFVSKYTYGYSQHSFPLSFIPFTGRIFASEPKRGDIVVFKKPADNRTDFIKRIIGLPGDEIEVRRGRLYVNGQEVEREEIGEYTVDEFVVRPEKYHEYNEKLPDGVEHHILEISDYEPRVDNTSVIKVPDGYYFMMGDNRDRSDDSRVSVGFVPFENLVGKAQILFFSHNDKGTWYKPWTWFSAVRWRKIFNRLK